MSAANTPPPPPPPVVKQLDVKVGLLLLFVAVLTIAFLIYVMSVRGVFTPTHKLTLYANDAEGIGIGMPLYFSGLPIGQVTGITLTDDARVKIDALINANESKWLRVNSVFNLDRPLIGAARINVITPDIHAASLIDGAERKLTVGAADLADVVSSAKDVLENIKALTAVDASLSKSLARLDEVSRQLERILANTDKNLYGERGMISNLRQSLARVDALLANAVAISENAKDASAELTDLRAQIDASMQKVNRMVEELNSKWPLGTPTQIKLP